MRDGYPAECTMPRRQCPVVLVQLHSLDHFEWQKSPQKLQEADVQSISFETVPSQTPPSLSACMLSRFSHVQLFVTQWTVALQAPLSMRFSRQEYWSWLPWSPGDLPNPGIEPVSLMSPALTGRFFTTGITWEVGQRHTFYFFKKLTFEYIYDCFSNLQFYLLFYFPLFALITFCCFGKKFS